MGKDSIWGERQPGNISRRVKTFVEREAHGAMANDAALTEIFEYLSGNEPFPQKKIYAEKVLNGEYGVGNEILAKFMLGPVEFREVIAEKRDIVPPLMELVSHESLQIRIKVAQALGERGDERALPALFNGLWEEKYVLRHEFGNALANVCGRLLDPEKIERAKAVLERRMNELEKLGKYEFASQHNGVSRRLGEVRRIGRDDDALPIPLQLKGGGVPLALQPKPERPDTTIKIIGRK